MWARLPLKCHRIEQEPAGSTGFSVTSTCRPINRPLHRLYVPPSDPGFQLADQLSRNVQATTPWSRRLEFSSNGHARVSEMDIKTCGVDNLNQTPQFTTPTNFNLTRLFLRKCCTKRKYRNVPPQHTGHPLGCSSRDALLGCIARIYGVGVTYLGCVTGRCPNR